jgi:hypothetical protein
MMPLTGTSVSIVIINIRRLPYKFPDKEACDAGDFG